MTCASGKTLSWFSERIAMTPSAIASGMPSA